MENIGAVRSIKRCFCSGMFLGFSNASTLCNFIVTGRRIAKTISKDDMVSID